MRRLGVGAALLALAALPAATSGQQLAAPLARTQSRERGLAAQARQEFSRLSAVNGDLAAAQRRLDALDADLAARRARLAAVDAQLRTARARLVRLRLRLEVGTKLLTNSLVAQYEDARPDLVNVVLEAHGFADLLERVDRARSIARADANDVKALRDARRAVAIEATKLGRLQVVAQRLTAAVAVREQAAAAIRARLAERQLAIQRSHARTLAALGAIRAQRQALEARIAAAQRAAVRAATPTRVSVGGVHSGGGFTFPMPVSAAAPPGAWSPDQGVDISAPGHTPLLAVAAGTVVLHGIGGFGAWAPVLHLDDGRYVYYGHAGPGNALPIGTHVGAGQVIGEVGAGIVGISTGPHLEIGFCDASGTPLGPQTAPTMLALLRAAY